MKPGRLALVILPLAILAFGVFNWDYLESRMEPDERPNIVLIYMDDVDCETVFQDFKTAEPSFPTLKRMADEGLNFTNFHVTTPVCGPSRACLYSGQYSHRNGIRVNNAKVPGGCGFSGGFRIFDRENEIGHWMKKEEYATAYVGKYLHEGFQPKWKEGESWSTIKPQAWDYFFAQLGAKYFEFVWTDGKATFEPTPEEHRTDREGLQCANVIADHTSKRIRKPLMLLWAPLSAHLPQGTDERMSATRHQKFPVKFRIDQLARYREEIGKEGGHPCLLRSELSEERLKFIDSFTKRRVRSLKSFDENLAKLRRQLEEAEELDNTIFIFTSDHGYSLGAHQHIGKRLPYDRVTRVPFLVSGKNIPRGKTSDALLGNIDIAPTLVAMAGGTPPRNIDGKSFAPLILDPSVNVDLDREGVLIENWEIEYQSDMQVAAQYTSLRMQDSIYTEWADGRKEYYNLKNDPDQTNNLFTDLDSETKRELWDKLHNARAVEMDPLIAENPTAEVLEPAKYGIVKLKGFAEDDRGIAKVEIEIQDQLNDLWWNGKSWQDQKVAVLARLGQSDGMITTWEFNFDPSGDKDTSKAKQHLSFSVIATDLQGNSSKKDDVYKLETRADEPTTWVESPKDLQLLEVPATFSGRATDDDGVHEIRMEFHDESNGLYWDGQNWLRKPCFVSVPFKATPETDGEVAHGDNMVEFSYTFNGVFRGHVVITVGAYDDHENREELPPTRKLWNTKENMERLKEYDRRALEAANSDSDQK